MKRIFGTIVLVCASVLSASQSARADDGREAWTCLQNIVTLDEFRGNCIGMVTNFCQATNEDMQNSPGLVACMGRETLAWDGILNSVYKELRGKLPEAERPALKAAQLGWIKDRDATCAFEAVIAYRYSGSASAEAEAKCKRDMTAERVVQIWYWRNVVSE